jgi:hypothetical protein
MMNNLMEHESEELHLSPWFKSLLEPFVTQTTRHASTQPLSA